MVGTTANNREHAMPDTIHVNYLKLFGGKPNQTKPNQTKPNQIKKPCPSILKFYATSL